MKATLYEALGVPQHASAEEVRSALRRQIRKYYAKTRDGNGNVEEALRFINHASCILSDPQRRLVYDHEVAVSAGSVEQRIAHVVGSAVASEGRESAAPEGAARVGARVARHRSARATATATSSHHPGLTERVASFRRSTRVAFALCTLLGVVLFTAIVFVTPPDVQLVARQVLVALTLALVVLTLVFGVVHGLAWSRRSEAGANTALIPQADLAILNWRREKSVFLGTNQPQEDASWVFQLRMAELQRAKSGRTSEPRPWSRLGARLFDYALWGLTLALPLTEFRILGVVPETLGYWLTHPLVAPMLITASWVPVEALLITSVHTTPGKWLFGVYLQFSISDAYAERDKRSQLERALKRAIRVWWEGVGCGFPLLAPILIAVACEKVTRDQETDWDFAQDCLVTHGPPGSLNAATGVVGLVAMLWLYGVAWHLAVAESITRARTSIAAVLPSPPWLRGAGFGGADSSVPTAEFMPPRLQLSAVGDAGIRRSSVADGRGSIGTGAPIDPDLARLFADRQARISVLKTEGLRTLEARNWRRARELCRAWTDLELGNAHAWRCLGHALQAEGYHLDAVSALRKAKQYDPDDRTLDAAIARSQRGILADFLHRQGR